MGLFRAIISIALGITFSLANLGALDPDFEEELTRWLGEHDFLTLRDNLAHDMRAVGYQTCSSCVAEATDTQSSLMAARQSGKACSDVPASIATHAWRYSRQELDACMSLTPGSSCSMSCRGLPELKAELRCSDTGVLEGKPAHADCRHVPDDEVITLRTGGQLRGLVRPIPMRWIGGNSTVERVRTFWGVPYGDEPERFKAPKMKTAWAGVRESLDYYADKVPLCPALPPMGRNSDGETEDCLVLNINVPPAASKKNPLPVFFYQIGGGFVGSDYWQGGWYDGCARSALRGEFVCVVISQRVGFLGHWASPALAEESDDGGFGNYEALDQRLALQWVQANIGEFGGDASRVTLVGHSSGSFGVYFHLLSPGSRGLFANAVVEGGTFDLPWYFADKDDVFALYDTLGALLGCNATGSAKDDLKCLRSLPVHAFYDIAKKQWDTYLQMGRPNGVWNIAKDLSQLIWSSLIGGRGSFTPTTPGPDDLLVRTGPLWPALEVGYVVDGAPSGLPATPREMYEAGKVNPATIYIDHTTNEGTVFALVLLAAYPYYKQWTLSHTAVEAIFRWIYGDFAKEIMQVYPRGRGDDAPFNRLSNVVQHLAFECSARRFAGHVSAQRPGSVFYGLTTYKGNIKSNNWASALMQQDVLYFLGASHMNHPGWVWQSFNATELCAADDVGSDKIKTSLWNEENQRMHELVICRYALLAHCGSPDGSNSSCSATKRLDICKSAAIAKGSALSVKFPPYELANGSPYELNPNQGGLISRANVEENYCPLWNTAPRAKFVESVCRGCAEKTTKQDPIIFT